MANSTSNEVTANDIKTVATSRADSINTQLEEMAKEYWDIHAALSVSPFSSRWEQYEAIARLSQLGLALHTFGKAYSAMNIARCNLPG